MIAWRLSNACPLPTRLEPLGEVGIGGPVAPFAHGRGRALEHVDVLRRLGQRRKTLDAARPGAHEGDNLACQSRERLVGSAPRVLVLPPCGVERAPGEVLHARDYGKLHEAEDPDGEHVPTAGDLVTAVGADPPPGRVLVPLGAGHPGVEQGVIHQVEPVGDPLEMAPDLLAERVAVGGDVVELLEHRDVAV